MWRLTLALAASISVGSMLGGCEQKKQDQRAPGGRQTTAPTDQQTTSGDGQKIKIGFLVKQPEERWFQNEWKFADQAGKKYGFDVIKIGVPDAAKVLTAIDNLAAQGAKGFVICTPKVQLGPAIVAKAKANNLKLFSVDDRFEGSDGKPMTEIHYMGISARSIGKMVGKALADEMAKRGWKAEETAAMGIGLEELETARERIKGATESLLAAGFPNDRIYSGQVRGLADIKAAFNAANVLLTQHGDAKNWLVFGMNDESVLGGIRALEGRGIGADRTIGVGIGGTTGMADWEKDKPTGFFAAVLISPRRHGYETAEFLYKWITDGAEPPKETYTDGILITRDNYKEIMREQGVLD
ncbi:MAG: substrate-binding domain-containing protein [Planctomycetota bacterium]|nr:substrate-binding domain-containing protein [Planctomycetota bacterium]